MCNLSKGKCWRDARGLYCCWRPAWPSRSAREHATGPCSSPYTTGIHQSINQSTFNYRTDGFLCGANQLISSPDGPFQSINQPQHSNPPFKWSTDAATETTNIAPTKLSLGFSSFIQCLCKNNLFTEFESRCPRPRQLVFIPQVEN